jgi:hypothetical protein
VHDSFIVDARLEDELKEIMERVYVHNFKKDIPVEDNLNEYRFTMEFIAKHRDEFERKIREGLADGTIDRDEFDNIVREKRKRHKELVKKFESLKTNDQP